VAGTKAKYKQAAMDQENLMSRDPEERFARQDSHRYSGWSSAFAIAAIVIVLMIVFLVYYLK
jgi:hypothetical protein